MTRPLAALLLCCVLLAGADASAQQGVPRAVAAGLTVVVRDGDALAAGGAVVTVRARADNAIRTAETSVDGVARFGDLPPGVYDVSARIGDTASATVEARVVEAQVAEATVMVPVVRLPPPPPGGVGGPGKPDTSDVSADSTMAPGVPARAGAVSEAAPAALAPAENVFVPMPDRWNIDMPEWDRYGVGGEYPYVAGHWWDPYNRNRLKGDYPILGQRTFFVFTGVADTVLERRDIPTQAGPSSERPLSEPFFGRGNQLLPVGLFRLSFDLFRGDTAFRPVDWRVRIQPAISTNYIRVEETGAVNPDVRRGTTRFDAHAALQEAFVEAKLADLSVNYDFVSIRAGIQELSTDFRGFIAVVEQPGVRVFGTLRSSRVEYNAAFFDFLEKDTNSAFNEWHRRGQQMAVANVYIQDFFRLGYTALFSVHYSRDAGGMHYDHNGFLVRPAPIGVIADHEVRSTYVGWAGNGHFGRLNLTHAFYQALGRDDLNAIEAQPVDINARMAALEVSSDVDWLRVRGGVFWASGDDDVSDGKGEGFDAILDVPAFAGGPFSVWNRQGIRLAMTGTGLVSPLSLLPTLRTNKDEGQQNFVNPGILVLFGGVNAELTPKLRAFANGSFLRFQHTAPLEALLFQAPIHRNVGLDISAGAQYRPPLSENIVLAAGAGALRLGRGLRDIYERTYFTSFFANLRLQF